MVMAENGHKTEETTDSQLPEEQLVIGQEIPGTVIQPTVEPTVSSARRTPEELLPTAAEADRILDATDELSGPQARRRELGVDRSRYAEATEALRQVSKNHGQRLEREAAAAEAEVAAGAERTTELIRSTFPHKDDITQPPKPTDQAA